MPVLDYQGLIADHQRIDGLAQQLEAAVGLDASPPQVDAVLAELARATAAHLAKEDSFIYPDLVRSDDAAGAAGLVADFEVLKQDWEAYLAAWHAGAASLDWPGFRIASLGMLHRLRERVMKETSLLYAMALREGLIALRQPPTTQV